MTAWQKLYEFLRSVPPGTMVSWEAAAQAADSPVKTSRGALSRARQELEAHGLTISGHCQEGFKVVST